MNYCALYKLNNGEMSLWRCFSRFYTASTSYKNIKVYILTDYSGKYSSRNEMKFSKAEVEEYLNALQKIGINFTWNFDANRTNPANQTKGSWEIDINTEENSALGIMILLNAIRYTYENPYQKIVSHFLELNKQKGDFLFSTYNKLMLSHYTSNAIPNGHTINFIPGTPMKYLLKEEVEEFILNKKNKVSTTDSIPKGVAKPNFKQTIKDLYASKDYAGLFKYWKELRN